jgi:hypothetical protein
MGPSPLRDRKALHGGKLVSQSHYGPHENPTQFWPQVDNPYDFFNTGGLRANTRSSKFQYEMKLKEWGLRKNLTGDEWKVIDYKTKKRKAEHKETAVSLQGFPIESKRVKKELGRRFPPRLGDMPWHAIGKLNFLFVQLLRSMVMLRHPVPSPPTPFGIVIESPNRAPGTPQVGGTGGTQGTPGTPALRTPGGAPTPENLGSYVLRLDNLPWFQFRHLLDPQSQ